MWKALPQYLAVLLACITFGLQESSAQSPILSTIDPASAIQGQSVQIAFRGKNYLPGQTTVAINPPSGVTIGVAMVTNTAQLTVSFTVAADAVPGERTVWVTTPNGTSSGLSFRVKAAVAPPTLTSISPTSGAGGTA